MASDIFGLILILDRKDSQVVFRRGRIREVICHRHKIRGRKLEKFLILRNVIALTLVPSAFYATYSAAVYASYECTFRKCHEPKYFFHLDLIRPEHFSLKVPDIKLDFDVFVDCVQW